MVNVYHFTTEYIFPYCDWGLKNADIGDRVMIEYHLTLPEPYSKKPRFVFWCGRETGQQIYGENGLGDDQIWLIEPNSNRAVPLQRITLFLDLIKDEG